MIFLEFTRFLLKPATEVQIQTAAGRYSKVQYDEEFDHTEQLQNNDTTEERILKHIKVWEEDHYGYCTIYIIDNDEYTQPRSRRISNRRKFIETMFSMGVIVYKSTEEL